MPCLERCHQEIYRAGAEKKPHGHVEDAKPSSAFDEESHFVAQCRPGGKRKITDDEIETGKNKQRRMGVGTREHGNARDTGQPGLGVEPLAIL